MAKMDLTDIPFTRIPNILLRSPKLNVYSKQIFCLIAMCGERAFPSYEKLMEWSGLSRERVWRSLKQLEEYKIIYRFKMGKKIFYHTGFMRSPDELIGAVPVRYTNYNSSPDEPNQFARRTIISSPDEPYKELSIKTPEKEHILNGAELEFFETLREKNEQTK